MFQDATFFRMARNTHVLRWMQQILCRRYCFEVDKCDGIKQYESEVGQSQFFIWMIVYVSRSRGMSQMSAIFNFAFSI